MSLSHFETSLLLAAAISVVLGITTMKSPSAQIRYAVTCFGYFLAALVGLGWLMYFGHG
jgi:putative Mn2+ efflux pump MntP